MTTTITSEHNTTATSSTGTTSSVAGQPLLDGSVTGSGGASVGSNNPSEHPSSQHPQPSILQLAAASLASTETDLVDIRRSQRLREEIDRLKSSIPMAAAPSGAILAPTPTKQATTKMPPQGSTKTNRVTSNSTYQQQKRSRKRSSTSLKAKSSVAPPASVPASVPVRRTGGPVTVTSRQHELAPLASLDYSITTDTSGSLVAPANGANNGSTMAADTKRQVTAAANLTSSASSSTIDTPTLSGYFDCDELSDMLDDSLFEITNAGCLSRSVFNRGEVKELPPNGLPAGANQNGQHDNSQVVGELEQLEDGDRTPTNQPKRPMTTSSSQPNFKRPNQAPPLSAGGPHVRAVGQQQQQQPQLTTPIVASQQQKQVYRPEMIRGQDYSSTSSVPNHVKASLASNQVNSIHGKQSSHQAHRQQHQQTQPPPATGHSLSSSANYLQRRRRSKTTTLTTNQTQRGPNEYEDEQEEDEETAAADGSSGDLTEPAPVAGLGKLSTTKQQPPSSSQPPVATKRRSQSNSMLGTGPPAKGSDYQQDINRRCPICCQTEGGSGSGHGSGKKASSGKRRFTFSLFNLFSGNSQQQPQKSNDDDHNQIATCHHHKFAPSSSSRQPIMTGNGGGSGSGSYATSSRKTPQASSTNGASTTRRRHHGAKAGITNPISNSSGQSTASARNNGRTGDQCPLPPIRLRDSIKITNQRKQRQNNRSATGKAPNEWSPGEPVAQSTQADEVLLDLSGPTSSRMNNTSRPRQSHQPALAGGSGVTALATTPRNKCVKFTTPDRVMFLSPEPPIEREHRVSASISSERLSRMVPNSGSNANNITRHLTSSQSSSQLGTVSAGSLLLDSQPPAPIIKWPAASTPAVASSSSVPKSSSYSQTEPNKGVEELLAKYEQNNKLVAEINEKLHLTETISSNKTALDGSMSQEGDDGEDEYEHAGSDGFVGEEQQLEQPVCLPPSGELLIGTGCDQHQSPDLATVHFETEEVDEDLLAAIQERLDELDVAATNESAIIMAEAPEDFSHCDCNDINQNNNQNSNSSGRLQQRTGAVGPPGSTTVTVRQGNVDEISSSGAIHQPDVIGVARAEAGLGDRDGDDKPPSTSDINGRRLTSQQRQANGPRRRPPEGGKGEKGAELGVQSEEPPATAPDEDEKTEYLHNLTGGPTRAFV